MQTKMKESDHEEFFCCLRFVSSMVLNDETVNQAQLKKTSSFLKLEYSFCDD